MANGNIYGFSKFNFLFIVLVFCCLLCESARKVSDEERRRKANLIQKFLNKYREKEGHVRLVGGADVYEGNVEILHNGKWGAVCDDEWGSEEAAVVCRQLNFGAPLRSTHSALFGVATRKYWLDNVRCAGDETMLTACRSEGWGISDCQSSEAAGVACAIPGHQRRSALSEKRHSRSDDAVVEALTRKPKTRIHRVKDGKGLKVRIRGGRIPEEGRIEVKYGENWGLVCGDGWSLREAAVVCRSLGLGYAAGAHQTDVFNQNLNSSFGPPFTFLSGTHCNGTESTIDRCLHDSLGNVTCPGTGKNFAGVSCSSRMADLILDTYELMRTAHLEDRSMFALQCAMEEGCLASEAENVQRDRIDWFTETRRLLRFTAAAINAGTDDFRPNVPKHMWEWHMCHMHYHSMEVFATFDILDHLGRRVAEGHKASFCLEDNTCLPGVEPKYACANYGDQGVSVNCSDVYKFSVDCQWVDISELSPGQYTMKVAINPEMKVPEMTFENNAAVCQLLYTETFATVYDCQMTRP